MRILVLGGTLFIGPHVVRRLADVGHDVTVFHRGRHEADLPPSVRHVHGDFADFDRHVPELRDAGPEVVLDMVPFRAEDGRRVHAFAGIARRAVALSSADVYRAYGRLWGTEPGEPDSVPLTENSPLRERLSHAGLGYDKVGVEREVMRDPANLSAAILRLPATHGPGDPQHRLFDYLKRMDDGRPAILLDEAVAGWQWSRGYVEDVAAAVALAVTDERAAGRVYNMCEARVYTEAEWVAEIARIVGWRGRIAIVPGERLPEPMRFTHDARQQYAMSSERIRRELGYREVVEHDEGLRRTIAWERAHPPEDVEPSRFDYAAEDAVLAGLA